MESISVHNLGATGQANASKSTRSTGNCAKLILLKKAM